MTTIESLFVLRHRVKSLEVEMLTQPLPAVMRWQLRVVWVANGQELVWAQIGTDVDALIERAKQAIEEVPA